MKKKLLILGSNSFSGNHLVNYLLKKKFFIIGCSLSEVSEPKFNCLNQLPKSLTKNFKFKKININKEFSKLENGFAFEIANVRVDRGFCRYNNSL